MQGAACGQCNLGIIYKDGIGVIKDYNKAFEWFEKAACLLVVVLNYLPQGFLPSCSRGLCFLDSEIGNPEIC